jgi:hypothetical protein
VKVTGFGWPIPEHVVSGVFGSVTSVSVRVAPVPVMTYVYDGLAAAAVHSLFGAQLAGVHWIVAAD